MAKHMIGSYEEFERWRRMIPERPDWHLHNWGNWRLGYHIVHGYRQDSAGMGSGGASGVDAFQHLCEPVDEWAARISDTVIDDLHLLHRTIISNVYEAAVWSNLRIDMEKLFIEAAVAFWNAATKKDLT
ncbi:hypothetical protein GALL_153190 [mine drainage metagenome]|uniref:Uncharacterized protein n=1 Tax=mine drainage metagenome TaxID=410659 RepID=A0A1J5SEG4_9ZZZZ